MSARTSPDMGQVARGIRGPGMDTRSWVTLAVVTDVACDAEHGVFADVQYTTGENETCFVASWFTGDGYGASAPLEVDDTVVVLNPGGDPNNGPVIVARLYTATQKPPAEARTGDMELNRDVIVRAKPGQKIRLFTGGSGDGISFTVSGDGKALLGSEQADQPFVRGNDYASAEATFLDSFDNLITAIGTAVTSASATASGGVVLDPQAIAAFKNARATFKNAKSQYLSTKVSGE